MTRASALLKERARFNPVVPWPFFWLLMALNFFSKLPLPASVHVPCLSDGVCQRALQLQRRLRLQVEHLANKRPCRWCRRNGGIEEALRTECAHLNAAARLEEGMHVIVGHADIEGWRLELCHAWHVR